MNKEQKAMYLVAIEEIVVFYLLTYRFCVVYIHTQSKTKYSFRRSDVLLLSGSLEYVSVQ